MWGGCKDGEGGGGGYHLLLALVIYLIINHASLSRRSTVPTSNRRRTFGRSLRFFHTIHENCLAYPIPVLFRRLWPSSTRIAIVFSLLSSLPNSYTSHSSIFLISLNTSRSVHISHSPTMRVLLYCCATRGNTCVHPCSPPPDYWYLSFSFLVGPGPLHKIAVSAFRVVHWAVQIRFHSNIFPKPPVYPLGVSPFHHI